LYPATVEVSAAHFTEAEWLPDDVDATATFTVVLAPVLAAADLLCVV
jgi:hypothetical protein